ncbi:DUF342 domain-containing protein [Ornithinibacillus californiensis]|uniref:DUF342 domain-containing protein n=1 Tax=Ornithinibacillus californiensis TaxID=161536 RepID=UPI00064E0074|nr:FapA family protein [Ornithinibacillus californiensis]
MIDLSQFFKIATSKDHMIAELHYKEEYLVNRDSEITIEDIKQFLTGNHIVFGLHDDNIKQLIDGIPLEDFPIVVANGEEPVPGLDGEINFVINFNPRVEKDVNWNFREVMSIPSVENNEKLASITLPTEGTEGTDVFGNVVAAKPGKPVKINAGKNVRFEDEDLTFYANSVGQATIQGNFIHIHPVFEVTDTLSMKEGNLDFIGTILIRGDVPSGYMLSAGGDIKIYGMVEAATIKAEGSIFISEGLSGLQKGYIEAGESIQIGYINQGMVHAAKNVYVENSILHSDCVAGGELICQRGSIIGGRSSAGDMIEVKHVGNYMNTRTELILGQSHKEVEQIEKLSMKKQEIEETLKKLSIIGDKLSHTPNIELNPKLLATLQRQKTSYGQNKNLLDTVVEQLNAITNDTNERHAKLTVTGNLYGNTVVTFGKYKRVIDTSYKQVELELLRNEIYMRSL